MQEPFPWLERFSHLLTPDCMLVVPTIECGNATMSIRTGLWPSAAQLDRGVPNPEAHMFATDKVYMCSWARFVFQMAVPLPAGHGGCCSPACSVKHELAHLTARFQLHDAPGYINCLLQQPQQTA